LTYKAHQLAKNQHPFIGRRIEKEVSRQSGHDFIATWVTLKALKARYGLAKVKECYTIWADRVMRGFLDNEFARPDISIYEQDTPKINIEVERTRKRTDFEKYQFLKKLKNYGENGIKTIVVFESREKAVRFAREVQDAAMGVTPWIYSNAWNKLILSKEDMEVFNVRVLILIWDYDKKSITEAFMSENVNHPIDVNTLTPYRS
jgi:superfamily II DNA helicase RecQ